MNHKLRVLVRVDVDPVQVTLEITGCITPSDSAALMHIVRRAGRLGAGADVVLDLHGASHLDPEVLLDLRRLADAALLPGPDAGEPGAAVPFVLTLDEPAELPICLTHVGADAEVLAGLDTDDRPAPLAVAAGGSGGAPGLGSTPGWGSPTRRWPRRPGASTTLAPLTRWRFRSTSRGLWIPRLRCGPCPTLRCASSRTPSTATSIPAALRLGRTPGTSSRPKRSRPAT